MRILTALLLGLSTFALFPACNKAETAGSCQREHLNQCIEYGPDRAAAGKRLCNPGVWTSGAGTCPVEARLGSCTRAKEGVVELIYSGPPNRLDAKVAEKSCTDNGGRWQ